MALVRVLPRMRGVAEQGHREFLLVPRANEEKPSYPPVTPHTARRATVGQACVHCRASVLNKTVGPPAKALAHLGGGDGELWVRSAERRMIGEDGAQLSPCRGALQ